MAGSNHGLDLLPNTAALSGRDRFALGLLGLSVLSLVVAAFGAGETLRVAAFWIAMVLGTAGALSYFVRHHLRPAGMQNDGLMFHGLTARGASGWTLAVALTGFYVILYWFPQGLESLIRSLDGLSYRLRGRASDQWFLYGFFYTFAVLLMGVRALIRYRHNRYQVVRTISVMFFQLGLAFVIPSILLLLNQPEYYFSYFWPLKYDYLWPGTVGYLLEAPGGLGVFMVTWGAVLSFVGVPVLTYFFGKRWYCSWVCGCGALAETMGDPFRHLSDKSLRAWRVERWLIHSVLVFVVLATAFLWANSGTGGAIFGSLSGIFSRVYGFAIGSVFAGVIGVGFYPLMGSRVWCRFGCPLAAILGILQKYFSRFRISTNGGQCISCGNCSKYCEMGIDVRWYAQRGQNIVRASCVGCGICSEVCPRGVLRLENGPAAGRYNGPVLIERDSVSAIPDSAGP